MELVTIPTEQTTAATDLVLALLAVASIPALRGGGKLRVAIWRGAFALMGLSAALGAAAHGLVLPPGVLGLLWHGIYLGLGLAVALFGAGALAEVAGDSAARRALPVLLLIGLAFYWITRLAPESFFVFILYEAVVMLAALAGYGWLVWRRRRGAGWMVAGILTSIVAAAIQATGQARLELVWPFDHNGLFHLVQAVGVVLLVIGLRRGLGTKPATRSA